MKASEIMTTEVVTVREEATVAEAARLMHISGHGGLPVINAAAEVVGLIDGLTLVHLVLPKYADDIGDLSFLPEDFKPFEVRLEEVGRMRVSEVMRSLEVCVSEDMPAVEVAALMVMKRASHVPVVRGRKLVGIVAVQNIVDEIVWPHFKYGEERP